MRFRMPAEWEPHERTLIGFPCRASSWGSSFETGRHEHWIELLDERLEKIVAVFELLESKYKTLASRLN